MSERTYDHSTAVAVLESLEQDPSPIFAGSYDGEKVLVRFANQAALDVCELTLENIGVITLETLILKADLDPMHVAQLCETLLVRQIDITIPFMRGSEIFETRITPTVRNGIVVGFSGVANDTTDKINLIANLMEKAEQGSKDALTGLDNRKRFDEELGKLVSLAKNNQFGSLLFLDLNKFKYINDTYGHDAGDQLLQQATKLLESLLRQSDRIFRIGGDEFGIILPNTEEKGTEVVVNKIMEAFGTYDFDLDGTSIRITISVGRATVTKADTPTSLYNKADKDMYRVKNAASVREQLAAVEEANTPNAWY